MGVERGKGWGERPKHRSVLSSSRHTPHSQSQGREGRKKFSAKVFDKGEGGTNISFSAVVVLCKYNETKLTREKINLLGGGAVTLRTLTSANFSNFLTNISTLFITIHAN